VRYNQCSISGLIVKDYSTNSGSIGKQYNFSRRSALGNPISAGLSQPMSYSFTTLPIVVSKGENVSDHSGIWERG
jgi:hypothetical protein